MMEISEKINVEIHTVKESSYLEGNVKYKVNDLSNIDTITLALYDAIFETINKSNLKISFIRHFVPAINTILPSGEPVYEKFNKGRFLAYQKHFGNHTNQWHIPAASAIGSSDNCIEISFKASNHILKVIENKCQIPAHQYSEKYGKYPPVFSRACIIEENNQIKLFASGTASIKGEDSQFTNDIYDQVYNTIENLRILGSQFNLKQYGIEYGFAVEDIQHIIVYYRNTSDLDLLQKLIPKFLSAQCTINYQQRNICRKELLVELEPVFIKKGDVSATEKKYKIEQNRIQTESFEFHLSEHCNLKCVECCNISPFNQPKFMSLDEIELICIFLKNHINPEVIKLSGGEPLLHPDIDLIVKKVKSYFPKTLLRITSNGLLAKKLNEDIFQHIDQIWISNYRSAPVSKNNIEHIKQLAKKHGVIYNIKSVDQFNTIFAKETLTDKEEIQQIYNDCWMRHRCLMVRNNRFFKCTRAAYIDDYLHTDKNGMEKLSEQDSIAINDSDFKTKALNFLNSSEVLNSCTYCLGVSGELIENQQMKKIP
nr:radical SAM protein [uncultured Carboxylicivirga sp.]